MTRLSVWAPNAATVDAVCGGRRIALEPVLARTETGDRGWYTAVSDHLRPGTDYAIALDGGEPLPDPRSPWQPAGVHGPSRVVDHAAFAWTDGAWRGAGPLAAQVLYELHVGTFTPEGTFAAASEHLTDLHDLGVTAIEIMPVAEFPGTRGWGYDGVDLYAPHHIYGGPEGLKTLVDRCHAEGIAVILDVVYNHLGPDGNYLSRFGPYFTDRYQTPWGPALNFDGPDSGPVRDFVIDNALMWLRHYHVDGLRLDAVHAIVDTSAVHLLEELAMRVAALETQLGRELWLIAESDLNDPRLVRPPEVGGYGLDASWNDDFHHAVHALLTGERGGYYQDFGTIGDLATAYQAAYVFAGRWSAYRRRRHGRPATGLSGGQFVSYAQNHDQIGNRAKGERTANLLDIADLKIAAALVLSAPFIPLLFQGEEWGATSPFLYFTDHAGDLGRAVKAGRQREFASFGADPRDVPDPQAESSFGASKLDWAERAGEPHRHLLDWHRRLIAWRRTAGIAGLRLDQVRADYSEEGRWLVVALGADSVLMANLADHAQKVPFGDCDRASITLASEPGAVVAGSSVAMPSRSVALIGGG